MRNLYSKIDEFLDEQKEFIAQINKKLRERNLVITIAIDGEWETREAIESVLSALNRYEKNFGTLTQFSVARDYASLLDSVRSLHIVQAAARELAGYWRFESRATDSARARPQFLRAIRPETVVDVKAAGREKRYSELSFGQKCGTILLIYLLNTTVRTIFLDQPEDHLDVSAVVFLLAPILEELSAEHDFIIASHSVNLVMALQAAHVSALQVIDSRDFHSDHGSISDPSIVEKILEILEGGTEVFLKRLALYSDFSERLRDQVESTDALLQTAFRRRTIDELRNYIQPIVSDLEIVRAARHDLKQAFVSPHGGMLGLLPDKVAQIRAIADSNFFNELDHVGQYLDSHIKKLQETVDRMRSLDKAPVKTKLNLRRTLEEIAERSIAGRQEERTIEVILDAELEQTDAYLDPQHFEIIMRNLLENSLRATEEKAFEKFEEGEDFSEQIIISVHEIRGTTVVLEMEDNGTGLNPEIADRLYRAKCSTQAGRDHGHGGLMIARLLELNGGGIELIESICEGTHTKTRQRIRLPLGLAEE